MRGIPLAVLALSVAVVAGYIEVYVEGGPDLDGLHIYAWDGKEWTPVHVIYVPEYIHTYIVATGQRAPMPHYNMSRYILEMPSEALTHNPPDTPPGLEKWTLEVQSGTNKVVVELAVGRTPITKGNLTLATWYSLSDKPPKTPHRGKFINPPRSPPKNNEAAGEVDTASYAVSPGTTIYPIGSLYFQPVKVRSGPFNTYVPVDTPIGYNTTCELPEMHWVGFEVQNFTVGVKVSGAINYGTLTLEFYNLDTCTLITTYTIQLPNSGRWANIDVRLPQNSQIGVRIRVDGYAPYDATIDVYVAARYVKTVNNLAQTATSKATTHGPFMVTARNRERVAVFFGPYVAYDGLASTATADTSHSYIYMPPHTARLRWTDQHCPPLTVYYYINGIAYTQRSTAPATSTPADYYCRYDVPPTVLQLRARSYAISKAQSKGGEITISAAYDVRGSPDVTISFNNNLEIVYHRWIEPFHSNYTDSSTRSPYDEWGVMLLRGTYQVFGLSLNMTSEIRISYSQIAPTLVHNQLDPTRHICGAEWAITMPVTWPGVYYGDKWIEEPLWAVLGKRLLNTVGWLIALGYNTVFSIVVNAAYNIFETASGSASVSTSNGVYTVRWIKGWAEPPPPTVVIELGRRSSSSPLYAEWRYFREGHSAFPWACIVATPRDVNTNTYLPTDGTRQWSYVKIWTWRGQTSIVTDVLTIHAR